ncbi:response regulator transcription factor [Nocardiopsis sp. RSe5-2]|uniref:Response regulator transcription factor n=1 Tax=Nocardiopsis endophytica TaxID=3018445 RepID=A0ABT4U839_9ACTN|nr:response regulator transcription factor [Nocardiopsis endophytica]MDA2813119.1 response regulator transcription factor [Nocardiopsis endophytica]
MRVILAEDSALFRDGLARLLADEGHEVAAAVAHADELVEAARRERPDVVIADVRMPPTHTDDGLRAALEVRKGLPELGILVLSQYVETRYAAELLAERSEGVGYVLKDRVMHVEEFLDVLDRVAAGATALDPEVVRRLMDGRGRTEPLGRLTEREREVLHNMAQGHTNAAISEKLHLSLSAIEKHINAIFDKLDLSGRTGYSRRVLAILRYLDV